MIERYREGAPALEHLSNISLDGAALGHRVSHWRSAGNATHEDERGASTRSARSTGLHGLTQLNVWWLRLGIQHQRIRRASPQENSAHERMHRTLKAETTRPPAVDLVRQQRVFTAFRREYNEERPHAVLGGDPPAARYAVSPRASPATLPVLEYPGHFLVKRVTHARTIRFTHRLLFLANALKEHHVGLEESADGVWSLYFGTVLLGKIDEATMKVYG